jgi:hypothetical protein
MTDAQALHKLRTAPDYFLKHYPINPAGATLGILPNQANAAQFKIYKPNNPAANSVIWAQAGRARYCRSRSTTSLHLESRPPPTSRRWTALNFTALAAPMVYWDQIPLNLGAQEVGALDG